MALLHLCLSSQSQTSYGRMYTRVGKFDFMTEPKFTPQNFIPGFVQNYRTALLKLLLIVKMDAKGNRLLAFLCSKTALCIWAF